MNTLDPDFQHALLSVQREYGRCGDKELGDLLIDLLVDRSKEDSRTLIQIVLNESLNVAPKLTQDQIASLSLIFLIRNTINYKIVDYESFGIYLDDHIKPLIGSLSTQRQTYQHLEFTGCGSRQPIMHGLEVQFQNSYGGLFLRGYTDDELAAIDMDQDLKESLFLPCLADNSKKQFGFAQVKALTDHLESKSIPQEQILYIEGLYNSNLMTAAPINELCCNTRPYMKDFINKFNTSGASSFNLTSVGIAIAHANLKRYMPTFTNLSIWI